MRWSNRNDDDKLKALLRGEGGGSLGPALAELREKAPEAPAELRERVRTLATEQPAEEVSRRPQLGRPRLSFAQAGAAAAAVLVVALAIPAIAALTGDDGGPQAVAEEPRADVLPQAKALQPLPRAEGRNLTTPPATPPPPDRRKPPVVQQGAAPVPSPSRAQDYSASITLHVDNQDELSEAVQSAIRSTRQLGGYVTYVDYGTSGRRDGGAELAVRVPVGRVQTAIARFSELGTILEQQTEIRDLQGQVDRITRDIQARRDRIAKLEAELKDPTLSESARDLLEARLVQAKRGLANATRNRVAVLRQASFAKLELAFTTEKSNEPAPPPSELRRTFDDALGVLVAELGVLLYVLIAGAPFIVLALLAVLGARALRRGANARVLERA